MTEMVSQLGYYVPKDWKLVAAIDESYPYEVDVTEIYKDSQGKYQLVTASGCSCWSGEYNAEEYGSLEELFSAGSLVERKYNPSPKGLEELVKLAKENVVA